MTLDEIRSDFPEAILWDGFDEAIIGFETTDEKIIYDLEKMVRILIVRDKMTEEESREYIGYNILGAYVGERTPIVINLLEKEVVGKEELTDEDIKKGAEEYCKQQRHENSVEILLCKADFQSGARWYKNEIKK
jgi:hypothetical protein